MFLNSMLKGARRIIANTSKPMVPALKRDLNGMAHLERDRFETLLDRVPAQLTKPEGQERKRYVATLQKTDLRGYQDYRQDKYTNFLKEAGVKPGRLQFELFHDLQASDQIRNNYRYFRQQQNKLDGTPALHKAQAIASSPALASEAQVFRSFKNTLIREPKLIPAKPTPPQRKLVDTRFSSTLTSSSNSIQSQIKPSTLPIRPPIEPLMQKPPIRPSINPIQPKPVISPKNSSPISSRTVSPMSSGSVTPATRPTTPINGALPLSKRLSFYEKPVSPPVQPQKLLPVKVTVKPTVPPVVPPRPSIYLKRANSDAAASAPSIPLPNPVLPPPRPPKTPIDPPTLLSNNPFLRRVSSDPSFSLHTPLSLEQVFGPNLKAITFKQTNGNTCYVLALLDNVLHHPQGEQMLKSIQFTKTSKGYLVKFPAQKHSVEVLDSELKQSGVAHSKHIGIPLLEQAYLKLPKVDQTDIGESLNALGHMFTEQLLPNVKPFNWNLGSLSHDEYKAQLQQLRHTAQANPQQLPIMTALRHGHIQSVRLLESTPTHITLLDPIHGLKKHPIDDFIKQFQLIGFGKATPNRLQGLRAALNDELVETLKGQRKHYEGKPENLKNLRDILLNDTDLLYRCYKHDADLVNLALDVK